MKSTDGGDNTENKTPTKQVGLAQDRTNLAENRTDMAHERTVLARERTELAKERNHLANERTFQAWIRTSLSLMALGFVIEQFAIFIRQSSTFIGTKTIPQGDYTWIIGKLLIVGAIFMLVIAYFRYHFIARKIGHSKHFPSKWLSTLVVLCIAVGVALIVYDLVLRL